VVEVFVSRLGLDSASNSFVVILQEKDGERILPIWIGRSEAESIAAHLNGVRRERPMTHDLATAIIVSLGGTLRRVQVTRVEESTFYAEMHIVVSGTAHVIDARPSDSIAIALRLEAPIYAADELLAEYETPDEAEEEEREAPPPGAAEGFVAPPSLDIGAAHDEMKKSAEELQRHLEQLRPEDFGKFSL
jgi:bifunctional DNase/RNase